VGAGYVGHHGGGLRSEQPNQRLLRNGRKPPHDAHDTQADDRLGGSLEALHAATQLGQALDRIGDLHRKREIDEPELVPQRGQLLQRAQTDRNGRAEVLATGLARLLGQVAADSSGHRGEEYVVDGGTKTILDFRHVAHGNGLGPRGALRYAKLRVEHRLAVRASKGEPRQGDGRRRAAFPPAERLQGLERLQQQAQSFGHELFDLSPRRVDTAPGTLEQR
jgi:hypothetical protein